MAKVEVEVGSIVQLKEGGPRMTVEDAIGENIHCVWFDTDNRLQREKFNVKTLRVQRVA